MLGRVLHIIHELADTDRLAKQAATCAAFYNQMGDSRNETPGFVVMLCLVAFAISPDKLNAEQPAGYSAKLISPMFGQVLYAGQQVRVEWKSILPHVHYANTRPEGYTV